jgi:omega-hydroxy-beta-dihydromenaquinone-9 sulfotransferase
MREQDLQNNEVAKQLETSMKQHLRLTRPAWRRVLQTTKTSSSHLNWRVRLSYYLQSSGYSLLLRLQESAHADALRRASPLPPIFLLGFWRSGTTFLHELFCLDKRFSFPSTYACLNPTHFLLLDSWVQRRATQYRVTRPMDAMKYSWISPQEDEFALLILGSQSPYRALLTPSLMLSPRALLDFRYQAPEDQAQWEQALKYFIRLLTLRQNRPLLLKSPPHGFRLPLLGSLFPQSRFVMIERNPYEVFASNLKLWQTLLEMYSTEGFSFQQIEDFVLAAFVIHEEAIAEGMQRLTPGRLIKVRYEDLIADPYEQMARVYSELGLEGFDGLRPHIERYLTSVADHKRNQFALSVLQRERLESCWGCFIRDKGYPRGSDYVKLAPHP